jgi:proline dehydrogenase
MDYDYIRHAVKTGDKILELARSLNLDPQQHTIKDLADTICARHWKNHPRRTTRPFS